MIEITGIALQDDPSVSFLYRPPPVYNAYPGFYSTIVAAKPSVSRVTDIPHSRVVGAFEARVHALRTDLLSFPVNPRFAALPVRTITNSHRCPLQPE